MTMVDSGKKMTKQLGRLSQERGKKCTVKVKIRVRESIAYLARGGK